MIETPKNDEMNILLGQEKFAIWENLCNEINNKYDINVAWNNGGKAWKYEYKFSKGGKTLCGLYAREYTAGFMLIFGATEREKVEGIRYELGEKTIAVYDEAKIYRDGKWVMFPLEEELFEDFIQLLAIKRKPDKINLPCKRKELSEMTLEEMWQLFPIKLESPNEEWGVWYKEEESELQKSLQGKQVRISHVGSTAVKGIWAKPTVDILLETTDNDFDDIVNVLDSNGWGCMSRSASRVSYQKGYTKYGYAEKVYHLHLRIWGDCDELYFRDYLNENAKVAKEYEELKFQLWKKFEHDRDAYTNAKGDFIKQQTEIAKRLYKGRY